MEINKYNLSCGLVEFQIKSITNRIIKLQNHIKDNKKDIHNRIGLVNLISKRKKLLKYLKKKNISKYIILNNELNLRIK